MMTTKNRGLGRGLDALLGGGARKSAGEQEEKGEQKAPDKGAVSQLGIELIQRGRYQPRRHFDEEKLQELADSISAQGVVQPIVVRPVGNVYEIIAGERRWRAAQLAGLHEIPAVVREVDDQAAMVIGTVDLARLVARLDDPLRTLEPGHLRFRSGGQAVEQTHTREGEAANEAAEEAVSQAEDAPEVDRVRVKALAAIVPLRSA